MQATVEAGLELLPSGRCLSSFTDLGLRSADYMSSHHLWETFSHSPVIETSLEELAVASSVWEHLHLNKNRCLTECQGAGGLERRVINNEHRLVFSCGDFALQSEGRLGINLFQVLSGLFV